MLLVDGFKQLLPQGWVEKSGFPPDPVSDFSSPHDFFAIFVGGLPWHIGSMYVIYGNIYHQYTPVMLAYIPYMDPMGDIPMFGETRSEWFSPIFWLLLSCYSLKYGGSEILHHQLGWLKAFLNHEMFTSYKPPINPLFIEFIPLFIGFHNHPQNGWSRNCTKDHLAPVFRPRFSVPRPRLRRQGKVEDVHCFVVDLVYHV